MARTLWCHWCNAQQEACRVKAIDPFLLLSAFFPPAQHLSLFGMVTQHFSSLYLLNSIKHKEKLRHISMSAFWAFPQLKNALMVLKELID